MNKYEFTENDRAELMDSINLISRRLTEQHLSGLTSYALHEVELAEKLKESPERGKEYAALLRKVLRATCAELPVDRLAEVWDLSTTYNRHSLKEKQEGKA